MKILKKLVPKKIKRMIYAEFVKFLSQESPEITKYCGTFIPYQRESNAYLLPKVPTRDLLASKSEFPIPPEDLCLVYADGIEHFLESGKSLTDSMRQILKAGGFLFKKGDRILDFGCGAGRMIRWFQDISLDCEIWGTDIRSESIIWCNQNLNPPFNFVTTTTVPHLPFEDQYFDLIYAGSVFTHIDDLADAWFLELRRILKPGGRLYVTVHDQNTIDLLNNKVREAYLVKALRRYSEWEEFTHRPFEMFTIGRSAHSQVFYDLPSFCRRLRSFSYQMISTTQAAYEYQTAILLKRN